MKVYELFIKGQNKGLYLSYDHCVNEIKNYYGSLFKSKNLIRFYNDNESLECWINCSKNQEKKSCAIHYREVK